MIQLSIGIVIGFFLGAFAVEFLWYGRRRKIHNIEDRERFENDFERFGRDLEKFGDDLEKFGETMEERNKNDE